jgi:hypothetical protein
MNRRSWLIIICGLLFYQPGFAETRLFIPQFSHSGNQDTEILLANSHDQSAAVSLWAFTTSGALLGEHVVLVPGRGTQSLSIGETLALGQSSVEGWIGLASDQDGIDASYTITGNRAEAGSFDALLWGSRESSLHLKQEGTGLVRIVNPNPFSTRISVRRKDIEGNFAAMQELNIAPFAQTAVPAATNVEVSADSDVLTWLDTVSIPSGSAKAALQSADNSVLRPVAIDSAVPIGAYQILLKFDPTTVQFSSDDVLGGTAPGFETKPIVVNIDNVRGQLRLASFQIGASPRGSIVVAFLRLPQSASQQPFMMDVQELTDLKGNSLVNGVSAPEPSGLIQPTIYTFADGSGPPVINDPSATPPGLSQALAIVGSEPFTITVNGAHFSNSAQVQIDGATIPTTFVNSNTLTATVPVYPTAGSHSVQVTDLGVLSNATPFKVVERGDINADRNVNIGDALALALNVGGLGGSPLSFGTGDLNLNGAVNIGDALVLALDVGGVNGDFAAPTISSTAPTPAIAGSTLTIQGTGFGQSSADHLVLFNTVGGGTARVAPDSGTFQSTSMTVTVPSNAVSGPIQVFRLDAGLGSTEYPLTVQGTATPLLLASVNPYYNVLPGDSLVLKGLGFDPTPSNNNVLFSTASGTQGATVTAAASTSLTVTVPAAAVCGPVTVTTGGSTTNAKSVIVQGPACPVKIAELKGGGAPGDIITLEGVGFDMSRPSNNVVAFTTSAGQVNATTVSAGNTQLQVRIPSNAITGNSAVTVASVTSNAVPYVVTGAVPGILLKTAAPTTGQVGTAGTFTVQVETAAGAAIRGVPVSFTTTTGNGSVSAGPVFSDINGLASANITLGTTAGTNAFNASVNSGSTNVAANVSGTAGPVTHLVKSSGDIQTGEAGTALASPFTVTALDQFNNAVPGVSVTFSVASGGGSITSSTSVTTDSNGHAQASSLLGSMAGAQAFAAAAASVSTVTFNATATLTASQIVKVSGDNQTGHLSTPLPLPLIVKIMNVANIPVPGQTVNWSVTTGGGSVTSQTVTDASGQATVTPTLGPATGNNSFNASVTGLTGSPIGFTTVGQLFMSPTFVDVQINSGATVIGSYQVTIHFDPTLLSVSIPNVTGGTGTGYTGAPLVVNPSNVAGTVTINSFQTNQSAPSGNFTVAHVIFTPKALGTTNLTMSGVSVSDNLGNTVSSGFLTLSSTSVTIN